MYAGTGPAPTVSIIWPAASSAPVFGAGQYVKVKAEAFAPPAGWDKQVQFFADTNLIGVATNPPFDVIWTVLAKFSGEGWMLTAIVTDNLGATAESAPVGVNVTTGVLPAPYVSLVTPSNGQVLAADAPFQLSAELLAIANGYAESVEFLLGTNSVAVVSNGPTFSATSPLYEASVTNLPPGDYQVTVRYIGADGFLCRCGSANIHVTELGIDNPIISPKGPIQFDVVTSFPGSPTVIEASTNLFDWVRINTNVPSGNTYTFTDLNPVTNGFHFYRAHVARP